MSLLHDMRYPAPHELALAARAMADEYPARVRLRQVGESRGGQPLWVLSVEGRGGGEVLVVAGAHANEPVGGATVLELARRVSEGPGEGAGWHFLLCADPDGAALHRTPRPVSLLDYHRHFYRPPGPEQPEWAPSLLPPDRLPPESLALTGLIDELRPVLQVSLHGTDLGGSWVQLTRDLPGLAEPFGKSAAELRIPVETGASDASGWASPGPGIFVMPDAGVMGSHSEDTRLSTWCHRATATAIVEVPMWASDLVDDPAPHPDPRGALRALAGRLDGEAARVAELREGVGAADPDAAALLRAVDWTLRLIPQVTAAWTGPVAPAGTTMAALASVDAFGRRLTLRAAAMLLRVVRPQGHPAAPGLDRLVTGWCEEFSARFRARRVPVATQVEHQSRTVLAAHRCLQTGQA